MSNSEMVVQCALRIALADIGADDDGAYSLAIARLGSKAIADALKKKQEIAGLTPDAFRQREKDGWELLKERARNGRLVVLGKAYWPDMPDGIVQTPVTREFEDDGAAMSEIPTLASEALLDIDEEDEEEEDEEWEEIALDKLESVVFDNSGTLLRLRPRDWLRSEDPWWREIEVRFSQKPISQLPRRDTKRVKLAKIIRRMYSGSAPVGCGVATVRSDAKNLLGAGDNAILQNANDSTLKLAIDLSRALRVEPDNIGKLGRR